MLKRTVSFLMALFMVSQFTPMPSVTPAQAAGSLEFYVDPVGGSDANNGLSTAAAWKTIEHARNHIRTINGAMTQDITVYLMPGTFHITDTLEFTTADSGTNGFSITYKAYNMSAKPLLSGGMELTGWESVASITDTNLRDKLLSGNQAGKNIWRAPVPGSQGPVNDPDPLSIAPKFVNSRQFYVDGERAVRAQSTNLVGSSHHFTDARTAGKNGNGGFLRPDTDSATVSWTTMHEWRNITNIEMGGKVMWKLFRGPVATVDDAGRMVTFQEPFWQMSQSHDDFFNFRPSSGNYFDSFWVENAYELLTDEGEWYLDKGGCDCAVICTGSQLDDCVGHNRGGYIYYIPRVGQTMASADAVLPITEKLLDIKGTTANKVKNLVFQGLDFAYTTWTYPNSKFGFPDAQGGQMWTSEWNGDSLLPGEQKVIPSAFEFEHASDIIVENCSFSGIGSGGLMMTRSQNIDIIGNTFADIAGNGISIGNDECHHSDQPDIPGQPGVKCGYHNASGTFNACIRPAIDPRDQMLNVNIINNEISNAGADYWGSVGLIVKFARHLRIEHNIVRNNPGMGISVGWSWGRARPTYAGDMQIRNNYVHAFNTRMDDGSGIYTLNPNPNPASNPGYPQSTIAGNHVDYTEKGTYGGIYLDNGSEFWMIENNVVEKMNNRWLYVQSWDTGNNMGDDCRSRGNIIQGNFHDHPKSLIWSDANPPNVAIPVTNTRFNENGDWYISGGGTYVTGAKSTWPQASHDIMDNAGLTIADNDAAITAAKAAIEAADLEPAMLNTQAEAKVYAMTLLNGLDRYGSSFTVHGDGFTPAVPSISDGVYTFYATLNRGSGTPQDTAQLSFAIAEPVAPVYDGEIFEDGGDDIDVFHAIFEFSNAPTYPLEGGNAPNFGIYNTMTAGRKAALALVTSPNGIVWTDVLPDDILAVTLKTSGGKDTVAFILEPPAGTKFVGMKEGGVSNAKFEEAHVNAAVVDSHDNGLPGDNTPFEPPKVAHGSTGGTLDESTAGLNTSASLFELGSIKHDGNPVTAGDLNDRMYGEPDEVGMVGFGDRSAGSQVVYDAPNAESIFFKAYHWGHVYDDRFLSVLASEDGITYVPVTVSRFREYNASDSAFTPNHASFSDWMTRDVYYADLTSAGLSAVNYIKITGPQTPPYHWSAWGDGSQPGHYVTWSPLVGRVIVFIGNQGPPVPCDVTFDTDGGSLLTPVVVNKGQLITKPTDPIRTGCTFAGWYKDINWTNEWNFATDRVQGDMTLYAGWRDPAGGSIGTPLVKTMRDDFDTGFSKMNSHSPNLIIDEVATTANINGWNLYRNAAGTEEIVYATPGDMLEFTVNALFWPGTARRSDVNTDLIFSTSSDGVNWTLLSPLPDKVEWNVLDNIGTDISDWNHTTYSDCLPVGTKYLKIGIPDQVNNPEAAADLSANSWTPFIHFVEIKHSDVPRPAPYAHWVLDDSLQNSRTGVDLTSRETANPATAGNVGYVPITGTVNGQAIGSDRKAFVLDGDNRLVTLGTQAINATENVTFSGWYHVTAFSDWASFFYNSNDHNGYGMAYSTPTGTGWNTPGGPDMNAGMGVVIGNGPGEGYPSNTQISTGQWVHVAMVIRNHVNPARAGTIEIYMNGVQISSAPIGTNIYVHPPNANAPSGGGESKPPGDTTVGTHIIGWMADVRFYETALSAAQMKAVYEEFFSSATPGLEVAAVVPPTDYNVTFKPNNGGTDIVRKFTEGTSIAPPGNLKKSGYTLDGWYTKDGTGDDWGAKWDFTTQKMPSNALALYAKWVEDTAPEIDKIIITRE